MASHTAMRAVNFKRYAKNSLVGIFDLELPSGMILKGCTLHTKGERHWTGLPGKPYTKENGEKSWSNIIDFKDKATSYKFNDAATVAALAAAAEAGK